MRYPLDICVGIKIAMRCASTHRGPMFWMVCEPQERDPGSSSPGSLVRVIVFCSGLGKALDSHSVSSLNC